MVSTIRTPYYALQGRRHALCDWYPLFGITRKAVWFLRFVPPIMHYKEDGMLYAIGTPSLASLGRRYAFCDWYPFFGITRKNVLFEHKRSCQNLVGMELVMG